MYLPSLFRKGDNKNISAYTLLVNNKITKLSSLSNKYIILLPEDEFEIPDTLYGFTAQDHFGLAGIRERVDLIGGEFVLQSSPNLGTTVQVVWPRPQ